MRLIDLHTDWLLQYAGESTLFDRAYYDRIADRFGQADGYLQTTSAAIVSCYRNADDWASQADPWAALGLMITRIEAEFSGRVLRDPADLARWRDDPDGLTWALIGIEGFDALIRSETDLSRLPDLWRRGVRLFQPSYTEAGLLAGSSIDGDDRGLTDLGRRFLDTLETFGSNRPGPRPIVDLAHLNPKAASEILDWFEADAKRTDRLMPVFSHGCPIHDGCRRIRRAISLDNLGRLRALGGAIGIGVSPPFYSDPNQIREGIEIAAGLPFAGRPGYEGIAIGTDFLGVRSTLPDLRNAEAVVAWVARTFPPDVASAIVSENARTLFVRAIGEG